MNRDIAGFPLPTNVRYKLKKAGFSVTEDFEGIIPEELAKEACLTENEALDVLKLLNIKEADFKVINALQLYHNELDDGSIVTFCEKLDDALGDGIPVSKITEVCGAPGIGKTQFCLQLSVDVQIPKELGGMDGDCIFIDTEGSFTIQRLAEVAKSAIEHCQKVSGEQNIPCNQINNFNLDNLMSRFHLFRCLDYTQLIAIVNSLKDFINEHTNVRLIVIDSVAFPFRNNITDMPLRTRLLSVMSQTLFQLASDHKLAVVLTNQMTSRFNNYGNVELVPALGESWGYVCTNRVLLSWKNGRRCASVLKLPNRPEITVPFLITASGFRDFTEEDVSSNVEPPQAKKIKV